MDIVRSIVMAFCMFSSIPMPKVKADEHSSRFMMAAFPLVGVVCGAVCIAWWAFCIWAHIGVFLHAAGLVLIPLIIAGGIHLDGFADVVDAISSWGTPERRREILKDSHIGAFAAMGICVYLLLSFALCTELVQTASLYTAFLLGLTFVLSRVLSGLTGMLFPKSSTEGMLAHETATPSAKAVIATLVLFAIAVFAAMALLNWKACIACAIAAAVAVALLWRTAMTKFGGMSGDLSGFFLQTAELLMLVALVVVAKAVGL